MKLLYWLILFTSLSANARVFSENFSSEVHKDSSTLIWNTELGILHPTLQIFGYNNPAQNPATSQTAISVSDGSDGAFEPSTYANFGTVVGNHIEIDASLVPILKVTRFSLGASYTLSSINGPLVIHSLSTVIIDGVIECHGNDGGSAAGPLGGAGGTGRCGGFSGGAGGASDTTGVDGLPTTGNVTGGGGAIYTGAPLGAGGGGGAAFIGLDGDVGANNNTNSNAGGNPGVGSTNVDHGFLNFSGSAGGGGGSGGGGVNGGGGGGGGGGGTVIIHAVSSVIISNSGAILAYGGNGGAAIDGGGGGGGGGGNIQIFTPALLEVAASGTIDANSGFGADPTNANAGQGGNGSYGRAWLVPGSQNYAGVIEGSTSLLLEGSVGFVSGTVQTATSKSFDTGSTLVTYQSIMADNASSDITFQVAGSDDNFVSDDSGWMNAVAISGIAKKRYIKYRINVNNSDPLNPTLISDVFISFDPGQQENFAFKSGGCGVVKNTPPNTNQWLILMLLLLPLFVAGRLRKTRTVQIPKEK